MANTFGGGSFGGGMFTTPKIRKGLQDAAGFGTDTMAAGAPKEDDPFDISKTDLWNQSTKAASDMLVGSTPQFDTQANVAREAQKVAQANEAKSNREALMGFGLRDTGTYLNEGFFKPADVAQREQTDLERKLSADKQTMSLQQQNAGLSASQNLLGTLSAQQTAREAQKNQFLEAERQREFTAGQTEKAQTFQSAQAELDRSLTKEVEAGRLSMQDKQLAVQAGQFNTELEFKKWATQAGIDDATAARVWQSAENAKTQSFQSSESYLDRELQKQIESGRMTVEQAKLAQSAGQFSSELAFKQWATQAGIDNETAARAWQSAENAKSQTFTEQQATLDRELQREVEAGRLSLEDRQLLQNAGQFEKELDYKRWATQAGLSDAEADRAWRSNEAVQQRVFEKEIAYAGLEMQEKELAEQSRQFSTRLEFDTWATKTGLDENEKQRIFEANQQANALQAQYQIATLQTDTEKWKQTRAEEMQRAGFTQESAMQRAQLDAVALQSGLDRALTREVEQGRLSIEEAQLAQQASQFSSEQEFKKWATQAGLDDAATQRAWQSSETAAQRVFESQENGYNRLFEKEIANMQIGSAEKQQLLELGQQASQFKDKMEFDRFAYNTDRTDRLAQQAVENKLAGDTLALNASQFKDRLEWDKEATKLGLADADKQRAWEDSQRAKSEAFQTVQATNEMAWQSSENAKNQAFQRELETARMDFERAGMNFDVIMQSIQSLPAEEAAPILEGAMIQAGISYVDENGVTRGGTEPVDKSGDPVWVFTNLNGVADTLNTSQLAQIDAKIKAGDKAVRNYVVTGSNVPKFGVGEYDKKKQLHPSQQTWVTSNRGKIIERDGKYYRVEGISGDKRNVLMTSISDGAAYQINGSNQVQSIGSAPAPTVSSQTTPIAPNTPAGTQVTTGTTSRSLNGSR